MSPPPGPVANGLQAPGARRTTSSIMPALGGPARGAASPALGISAAPPARMRSASSADEGPAPQGPLPEEATEPNVASSIGEPAGQAARAQEQAQAAELVASHQWLVALCRRELEKTEDGARAARLHFEIARILATGDEALIHYRKALAANPDHLPAVRLARRLLLQRGEVDEALLLFEREATLVSEPAARARVYYDKGLALESFGGEQAAIVACFRRAAELQPACLNYHRGLERSHHRAGDWAALEAARQGAANAVTVDPRHRAAIVVERARLQETRLADPAQAAELYRQALDGDEASRAALSALKRLYGAQGRYHDLVDMLEREARATTQAAVATESWFRIGRVFSERLGDRASAINALARARQSAPRDRLVLGRLSRLYRQEGDDASLAHVLACAAEVAEGAAEQLSLLVQVGEIYRTRLGDDEQARRWYDAALRIDPAFPPALAALDGLHVRSHAWQALIVMYLAASEACSERTRHAAAHSRIASIFEEHLAQPEEAIRHHQKALATDPSMEGSFKALVRLFSERGLYRELMELYERGIDRAVEQDLVVSYLFKIGSLCEDAQGSPEHAMAAYQRILVLEPANLGALHAFQRAAERGGRHRELVGALQAEAALTEQLARQVALVQRAGEIMADSVRDSAAALLLFERVLQLDATHAPAFDRIGLLLTELERFVDLRQLYERQLCVTPAGERTVALLYLLGRLSEQQLGQPDEAVAYYRRAIALDAGHAPSLQALALQLHRRRDYTGLVEVIRTELSGELKSEERANAAYRLGEVYEVHLGQFEQAASAYQESLAAVDSHRPSREGLMRVSDNLQRWDDEARLLVDEAQRVGDRGVAVSALLRAAEIHSELLGQPSEAVSVYEAVRAVEPNNLHALLALEPLYRGLEAWPQLADVYATQAGVLADPEGRVTALEQLVRALMHQPQADPGALRRALQAILSIQGGHLWALSMLEEIALREGDQRLLADLDVRFSQALADPACVAVHQARLGELLEASSPQHALGAYKAALDADPTSISSIVGMVRTAKRCGDAHHLIDGLQRQAQWTSDGELAADALVESADVRSSSLRDDVGASRDAEEALRRSPDHEGAARSISDLLRRGGEVARLIDALSRAANAALRSSRVAALWRMVSRLYADERGDLGAALAALDRLDKVQSPDAATLQLRGDLLLRNEQWADAAVALTNALSLTPAVDAELAIRLHLGRVLARRLGKRQDGIGHLNAALMLEPLNREALVLLFDLHLEAKEYAAARGPGRRLLEVAHEPEARGLVLLSMGRLELAAGRRSEAATVLREAVEIDGPSGAPAKEYKKLLGAEEPWERYVEALSKHLRRVQSGELQNERLREVYLALARTQHEVLLKVEDAVTTLRAGLEVCGRDPVLRFELAEGLSHCSRSEEAVAEYRVLVKHAPGDVRLWRGMARAYHEAGKKLEAAVALGPLVLLEDATDIEAGMSRQRKVPTGNARPGSLDVAAFAHAASGDRWDALRVGAVLDAIEEAVVKIYPPDFDSYGVTPRDRVREGAPIQLLCSTLAEAFGVAEFELYLHRGPGLHVVPEAAHVPTLMAPQYIEGLPTAQQAFMLARAFFALTAGVRAAFALGQHATGRLLCAATRLVNPVFPAGPYLAEDLSRLQKRLQKALSRRARKQLEGTAPQYAAKPAVDLDQWWKALQRVSIRVAAIVANDLPEVVQALQRSGEAPTRDNPAALLKKSPLVADLVLFWPTAEAFELRRTVGVL